MGHNMSLIESKTKELPIPIKRCDICVNGIIFKSNTWFQCCDCGNVSTEWGGNFQIGEPSQEWKDLCRKSQSILNQKR